MKNILLPTDFSVNSMNAITYAMRFFEHWECDFYILNVQKVSEYVSDDLMAGSKTDSVYDSIARDNKEEVTKLVKKLSKQYKSQSFSFHGLIDYDDLVSAVDQAIQSHSIDLIIMGSNGATGAKEVLFGSNTLHVIRKIDSPTLIVPQHYKFVNIERVLFSTVVHKDFAVTQITAFKKLLDMHRSQLLILELDEDALLSAKKEDNESLKELFPDHPYTYYRLNTIAGVTALNTATQLLKVDLHATFIERTSFLERLIFGSENSTLLYRTSVPLLFLHREV